MTSDCFAISNKFNFNVFMSDGDMEKETSEQVPVHDSGVRDIDRRAFLKNPLNLKTGIKAAAISAVTAGAALYLGGKDVFTEGIPEVNTPEGNFSIVYDQNHRIGIKASDIPKKRIDLFFKEGTITDVPTIDSFNLLSPKKSHNLTLIADTETLASSFGNPESLIACIRRGIPIAFMDVLVPENLIYYARSAVGAAVGFTALKGLLDDSKEIKKFQEKHPEVDVIRHNILKGLGTHIHAGSASLTN